MKNMVKKNQIMITALAIMIAVAGYLHFAGDQITDEGIMTAGSGVTEIQSNTVEADTDVAALFEISDEDMEQAEYGEIQSLDSDVVLEEANYLDETMGEVTENVENQISDSETPGEAVFTSATSMNTLSGARL